MNKIIVATHGKMAEGLKSTLEFFGVDISNMDFLSCYCESNEDIKPVLETSFDSAEPGTAIIVFTDMLGGSVNTEVMQMMDRNNVHVISGFNLVLLLQLSLLQDCEDIDEIIRQSVEEAKQGLVYVNDLALACDFDE